MRSRALVALESGDFANGNRLDSAGRIIPCQHGGWRVIRRPDPENLATVQITADRVHGRRLNTPNDLAVRSDGSIWFAAPPGGISSDVERSAADSE